MKVLIVCSGNFPDPEKNFTNRQPFIYDQMAAISRDHDVEFDVYLVKGKGLSGYLANIRKLRKAVKRRQYDLVHAHFSLSGFISLIVSRIPVVITFHGSDINLKPLNILSSLISLWADHVIFVSEKMAKRVLIKTSRSSVIPCGVDPDMFCPLPAENARMAEGMEQDGKYILFSSSSGIEVKNYPLARKAVSILGEGITLVELRDRKREEVRNIINACDVLLMTSFTEGSPQIIKEAMACSCPVVSTDVGDVRDLIGDTEGCYITSFDPYDVAEKAKLALDFGKRTKGREKIMHLDNKIIAGKIVELYRQVLDKKMRPQRR
jgi:teichuronic acid biosynthesis glycosyltransferase TuaC